VDICCTYVARHIRIQNITQRSLPEELKQKLHYDGEVCKQCSQVYYFPEQGYQVIRIQKTIPYRWSVCSTQCADSIPV